jgi:hypothetical protein
MKILLSGVKGLNAMIGNVGEKLPMNLPLMREYLERADSTEF